MGDVQALIRARCRVLTRTPLTFTQNSGLCRMWCTYEREQAKVERFAFLIHRPPGHFDPDTEQGTRESAYLTVDFRYSDIGYNEYPAITTKKS